MEIIKKGRYRIWKASGIFQRWILIDYRVYNTGLVETKDAENRFAKWTVGHIPEGAQLLS